MNSQEARVLEMLIRVRQFGLTHTSAFPASSRGSDLFQAVGGFIDSIENLSTTYAQHTRAAREQTVQKKMVCDAIRRNMAVLARTARGMKRIAPGIHDKFRLPKSFSAQAMLTTARAVAAESEQQKEEFIRRGMPANFLQEFVSLIEDLEEIVDSQAQNSAARVLSKAAVNEATQNARGTVRELDTIVLNVYGADASVLAEWESASHIERSGRRAETPTPPAEPGPTEV